MLCIKERWCNEKQSKSCLVHCDVSCTHVQCVSVCSATNFGLGFCNSHMYFETVCLGKTVSNLDLNPYAKSFNTNYSAFFESVICSIA